MTWRDQAGVVVGILILTACSGGVATSPKAPPGSAEPTATSLRTQDSNLFRKNEVRGDSASGSLWALFYHRRSGESLKTIWRMTGTGDFAVEATGPDGQKIGPDRAPVPHAGSNWNRPGDEWGVFWTIPRPGRWTFEAKRGDGTYGTISVEFS